MNQPPWWVPYIFIGMYAVGLTYGWLVVDKVPTSDFFVQFALLLNAAFGIQINTQKKLKGADVQVEGEDVTVTRT